MEGNGLLVCAVWSLLMLDAFKPLVLRNSLYSGQESSFATAEAALQALGSLRGVRF